MLLRSISLLALAATLGSSVPLAAQNAAQGALLAGALDAAGDGDWVDARDFARQTGSPMADDLVLWTRLRDGAGNWDEYLDFLARHPDWPGARRRCAGPASGRCRRGCRRRQVFGFFDGQPPQTGIGSLRLAEALSTAGREAEAEAEIVRAWTTFSMTGAERTAVLGALEGGRRRPNEARLDMLLWRGLTSEAEAMLPPVSPDWQKLAQARIARRRDAEGLQYAIDQVPRRRCRTIRGSPTSAISTG